MSKQFLGVIAAIVLLFIGIFVFSGNKTTTSGSKSSATQPTNHVEGKGSTGVTLVEYGDYQCPFCEAYTPTLAQVRAEFADKITFQFRNFPITSAHPNAYAAARAAEAAGLQNKFWEMHDLLYVASNWQSWTAASDPIPYFNQYATQLGLNAATFKTDFVSSKVNDLIKADQDAASKLNVSGTPTYYLDGKEVQIGNTVAAFEKVINAEIAKKQPAAATPAAAAPAQP